MRKAAEERKERHVERLAALDRHQTAEASRQRAATAAGPWIRRLLVLSMVFAVVLAPFVVAVFTDQATIFQYSEAPRGLFGKLFAGTAERVHFEPLKGYVLTAETRQSLLAIIAFYFGQGAAK